MRMKNKILVVAAHPDDEILGIGGTILKHSKAGDDVFCVIMGEGLAARRDATEDAIEKLHEQSRNAGDVLGFREIRFFDFPDNRMDSVDLLDVVKKIESLIDEFDPDIIYTHHGNDLNIDHQICFQAVMTAARPIGSRQITIYTFETLSSTEWHDRKMQFMPNTYVDIADEIDGKIKAMKIYSDEIRAYPHPRSPEGIRIIAQFRGLESGLEFAEALRLVREIKK